MWVASTKGEGILFMVLALLMLGTWPAIFNLVERRGRLPTHTCAPSACCTLGCMPCMHYESK